MNTKAPIVVTPRVSEKAYAQSQLLNTYIFDAPLSANKNQIADAVAAQYDVTVQSVRTVIQAGKAVRYSRGKHRFPGTTNRKDSKKAYVTLAEGNSIAIFEAAEAAAEQEKK